MDANGSLINDCGCVFWPYHILRPTDLFDAARKEDPDVREVFEQNAMVDEREWMVDRGVEDGNHLVKQGWLLVAVEDSNSESD